MRLRSLLKNEATFIDFEVRMATAINMVVLKLQLCSVQTDKFNTACYASKQQLNNELIPRRKIKSIFYWLIMMYYTATTILLVFPFQRENADLK